MKKELSFAAVLMMLAVCAVVATGCESEEIEAETTGGSDVTSQFKGWFDKDAKKLSESEAGKSVGVYEYCSDGTLYVRMHELDESKEPRWYSKTKSIPWYDSMYAANVTTLQFENFVNIYGNYDDSNPYFPNLVTVLALPSGVSHFVEGGKNLQYTNNVTTIGSCAFSKCEELVKVVVGGVTTIASNAFKNCKKLSWIDSVDRNEGDPNRINLEKLTSVGSNAFYGALVDGIEVKMQSLQEVGTWAFQYSGIGTVNAPNLRTIPNGVFYGCGSLQSVKVINVTKILDSSFNGCTSLEKVVAGEITSIGANAFGGCKKLSWIDTKDRTDSDDCISLNKLASLGANAFNNALADGIKVYLNSLQEISNNSFMGSGIKEIDAPDLLRVKDAAFSGCSCLQSLNCGSLNEIGGSSFKGCTALKTIGSTVGQIDLTGLTDIADSAFSGCTSIGHVVAGELKTVGSLAFNNCTSLEEFDCDLDTLKEKNGEGVCNIPLVETLYDNSFYNVGFTTVFAYKIQTIGKNTFANTELKSFNSTEKKFIFPPSINEIGSNAFSSASTKSIDLPSTEISLGATSFYLNIDTKIFIHDVGKIVSTVNGSALFNKANTARYTVYTDTKLTTEQEKWFSGMQQAVVTTSTIVDISIFASPNPVFLGYSGQIKVINGGSILLPYTDDSGYESHSFGIGSDNPEQNEGNYKNKILKTDKTSGEGLTIHTPSVIRDSSEEPRIHIWNGAKNGNGLELIDSINVSFSKGTSDFVIVGKSTFEWKYGGEVTSPKLDGAAENKQWLGDTNKNLVGLNETFTIGWWETGFTATAEAKRITITWYSGNLVNGEYTRSVTTECSSGSQIVLPGDSDVANRDGYEKDGVEWYTSYSGSGTKITEDSTAGYSDLKLYARYTVLKEFTIVIHQRSDGKLTGWNEFTAKGPYKLELTSADAVKITDSSEGNPQYGSDPNKIRPGYAFLGYTVKTSPIPSNVKTEEGFLADSTGVTSDLDLIVELASAVYNIGFIQKVNDTDSAYGETVSLKYQDVEAGYWIDIPAVDGKTLKEVRIGNKNTDYQNMSKMTVINEKDGQKAELTLDMISDTTVVDLVIYFVYSNGFSLNRSSNWGDEPEETISVIDESTGTLWISPPSRAKPGYSFDGWAVNGTKVSDETTEMAKIESSQLIKLKGDGNTITLEAQWAAKDNIITFKWTGDDETEKEAAHQFKTEVGASVPVEPARTGYTFTGWNVYAVATATGADDSFFVAKGAQLELTDEFMVVADGKEIQAEAQWVENAYTIRFYDNIGSQDGIESSRKIKEYTGIKYTGSFQIPSSEGIYNAYYDFLNWAVSGEPTQGKTLASGDTVRMTEYAELAEKDDDLELVIYMVWNKINYRISYSLNGGTGSAISDQHVEFGESLVFPTGEGLIRTGYTFRGWSGNTGDDNAPYDNGGKMDTYLASLADSNDRVVLYAVWNPQSYKVSYSLGGGVFGTDAPETVYSGVEFEVSHPKRIGYKFTGWTASGSDLGDGAKYQIGQRFMAWNGESTTATVFKDLTFQSDKTVAMTANWEIADIKILYDLNGGSGTVSGGTTQGHVGMTGFQFPTISGGREGYKHAGWSIDKISVLSGFTDAVVSAADEDNIVTLYAVWTPQSYYIEFRSTDQDEYMRTEAFYDVSTELGTPERLGYTFKGWTSSDITSSQARYSMNEVVWLSWPDKSAANGSYVMNLSSQADKAVHLTATWEANSYRVVYSPNGGAGDAPKDSGTYKIGDAFELASTESLKGTYGNKILVGWATDAVATVPLTLDTFVEGLVEKADRMNAVTLYAVWVEGSYTVSVDVGEAKPSAVPSGWELQDGKYVRSADYGTQTKDVLADWDSVVLEWDGHVFTGWKYDISSVITNISVTADYDEIKQWIIYAFVGIVAAVAIIAVVFTRLERW